MYSSRSLYIVACVLCVCACFVSARPPISYIGDVVIPSQNAEAQAAALTNSAGAAAAAAKIDAVNWRALDQYGREIGVPLLHKPIGHELDNLYAASLQPRSFVGRIEPVFKKNKHGQIKFISGSSIGVAAI